MEQQISSWKEKYAEVKSTLMQMRKVESAATAFNTNVDAVLKIKGRRLAELAKELGMSWEELTTIGESKLNSGKDVIKGAFRCFANGIAEEWLTEDIDVYNWMANNLGYDRLQMGGQAGIVANALAVCGVRRVLAHCNSLPKRQADQFLPRSNLVSFDEKGEMKQASEINRQDDIPLIHWIIEFDKGDVVELDGHKVSCPKANRFIATYDPMNLRLVMDNNFLEYLNKNPAEVTVLSGYHALTAGNNGVELVEGSVPVIKRWQDSGTLVHLEVASTQDKDVRRAVVEKVASLADSIGLNERETIDVLEVIGEEKQAQICEENCSATNLFEAVLRIKQKVGCRRLQLHMFGLYLTIQDKGFKITPEQNLKGMCLAAVVAASKAGSGNINEEANLMWAYGLTACDLGLQELGRVADYIGDEQIRFTGIGDYAGYDVIAVPTILVEKPVTLVGMGDTISSVSLVGALKAV